ncbi:glucokinase [Massilia sp. 9096]|uniref:glucokinase n=1 Tax=Massilia sp. 9096 TaxID=1500894 RepID=UPI000690833C|nr:glucokinase [Massilia sp. 9096]
MNDDLHAGGARLLADIGGTNARFALERAPGRIEDIETLACADYASLVDAVRAYLARHPAEGVRHAVIAIATAVDGDFIKMTNHCWEFSTRAAREALGFDTLLVLNDFAALAMSVPGLPASELVQVGGVKAAPDGVIGIVGAGTGLGVAGLIPSNGRWNVLQSEGGHMAFSPCDAREQAILGYCWTKWPHVSSERLVSGPGLATIHEALVHIDGASSAVLTPAQVVERALDASDPRCVEALDLFCGMLGTVAANVAVTFCARGGIYIGGGVVPRLKEWFARSRFRSCFENKGRYASYLAQIPVYVIHSPYPALSGAAAMLEQHLLDAQAQGQSQSAEHRHAHA